MKRTLNKIVTGSILALNLLSPVFSNAQETDNCQETISQYQTTLSGTILKKGSLDRFKPKNHRKSHYSEDLANIREFLKAYDSESCGADEALYQASIDALFDNLETEDAISRSKIRNALEQEGYLNFSEQMEEFLTIAENIQAQALDYQRKFPHFNPAKQKRILIKLRFFQDYLQELADYSSFIATRALLFRELPPGAEQEITREEIKEGEKIARETYQHLQDLQQGLAEENWTKTWRSFNEWKNGYQDSNDSLLDIHRQALDNADYMVATRTGLKSTQWQRVTYRTSNGETKVCDVSNTFATQWGNNGEHFYGTTSKILRIKEQVSNLDMSADRTSQEPECIPQEVMDGDVTAIQDYFNLTTSEINGTKVIAWNHLVNIKTDYSDTVYNKIEFKLNQEFGGEESRRGLLNAWDCDNHHIFIKKFDRSVSVQYFILD